MIRSSSMGHISSRSHSMHSIRKSGCPVVCHNQHPALHANKNKKASGSSIRDYIDIEKIITDIKIKPKDSLAQAAEARFAGESDEQKIQFICTLLDKISSPIIRDEIKTVQLLMGSMKKLLSCQQLRSSSRKAPPNAPRDDLWSPIQLIDESPSKIIYTNFSIKNVESVPVKDQENAKKWDKNFAKGKAQKLITPKKLIVSQFQEDEENRQINRINQEIGQLENLLKRKGFYKTKAQSIPRSQSRGISHAR